MTACDQLLEPLQVEDFHVAARYFHQLLVPQVRDAPADGFQAQAQVGADLLAAHFQDKFPG